MAVIEVFADIACPFTHVGLHRFVERRAETGRHDVKLHVRAWPLELVNGVPMDPHHIASEIDDIVAQVAPELFRGFSIDTYPTTSLPALRLAAAAYEVSMDAGEQMSLALRDALFEQGRDLTNRKVLKEIAYSLGVPGQADEKAVHVDWQEGRARGVVGSPHFFSGDSGAFCPLLHIEKVDGHLRITQDPSALDDLLRA
ncbi:MAG TPA: DsbA family protein [Acidimicrobiales bacterium]